MNRTTNKPVSCRIKFTKLSLKIIAISDNKFSCVRYEVISVVKIYYYYHVDRAKHVFKLSPAIVKDSEKKKDESKVAGTTTLLGIIFSFLSVDPRSVTLKTLLFRKFYAACVIFFAEFQLGN